jgi:hypothetical protein
MALLLSTLWSLRGLKQMSKDDPSRKWIADYSDMLQVSVIAFMVCGAFLGRAYFDLFYNVVIMAVILKVLAKKELQKQALFDGAKAQMAASALKAGLRQKVV